jgi:hypothetical protein
MSQLTGDDVFRNLMDLDLLLQDGGPMVRLKLFLGTIAPDNPALHKLNNEILFLTNRLTGLIKVIT